MANFFDSNIDRFHEAAAIINRQCSEFAGKRNSTGLDLFAFMTFARAFSKCDAAVRAINFECRGNNGTECMAQVGTDGSVAIVLKSYWDEWCMTH